MHTKFWSDTVKGKEHSEELEWEDNIRMDLREIRWEGMG